MEDFNEINKVEINKVTKEDIIVGIAKGIGLIKNTNLDKSYALHKFLT